MKTIGIIGGLGPMATVYYLELITRMTEAEKDQEHPRVLLEMIPDTPDRTGFILGRESRSPFPYLLQAGKELAGMGADFITVPCVTAQYFYEELSAGLSVPVVSICRNLAADMAEKRVGKVGLLATDGTIQSKVLEKEFINAGVEVIVPPAEEQCKVMGLIGRIKEGNAIDWHGFHEVSRALFMRGAEKLVLGCTELSLLKRERELPECYVDVLEVLARKAVLLSGAALRKKYNNVI